MLSPWSLSDLAFSFFNQKKVVEKMEEIDCWVLFWLFVWVLLLVFAVCVFCFFVRVLVVVFGLKLEETLALFFLLTDPRKD